MQEAIARGDIKEVERLLPGTDINARYGDGNSALILAAMENNNEVVELLLRQPDILVNMQCNDGYTALHWAISSGNAAIVASLLKRPDIDINIEDEMLSTPLEDAVYSGYGDIVAQLLKMPGLNVHCKNKALASAALYGNEHIVVQLLAVTGSNAVSAEGKNEALITAIRYGHIHVFNRLLEAGAIIDIRGALHHQDSSDKVIKYLMYMGKVLSSAEPPKCSKAALHLYPMIFAAVRSKCVSSSEFLKSVKDMFFSLERLEKIDFNPKLPHRIDFLAAKIYGVLFSEDVILKHTGAAGLPAVGFLSALMRSAKIIKLTYGKSIYLLMRTLLFRYSRAKDSGLIRLPFKMKSYVSEFIVGDRASYFMQEPPTIERVSLPQVASSAAAPIAHLMAEEPGSGPEPMPTF